MALVTLNQLLILSAKGHLGNIVIYPHKSKPELFIMRGKGKRSKPFRDAELRNQLNFKLAQAYAKVAQNDSRYQAAHEATHREVINIAIANYLNAPVVQEINLTGYTGSIGDLIRITADDDFEVTRVLVKIFDLAGAVLEDGTASRDAVIKTSWTYVAQTSIAAGQTVVIEVAALDDPDNRATKKVDHACGPRVV